MNHHDPIYTVRREDLRLSPEDKIEPIEGTGVVRLTLHVNREAARRFLDSADAREALGVLVGRETLRALGEPCECGLCVDKRVRAAKEADLRARWAAGTLTDADLVYSAAARCKCGAGLAYLKIASPAFSDLSAWFCSDVLLGGDKVDRSAHDEPKPFAFWKVLAEVDSRAKEEGLTTRPVTRSRVIVEGDRVVCPACNQEPPRLSPEQQQALDTWVMGRGPEPTVPPDPWSDRWAGEIAPGVNGYRATYTCPRCMQVSTVVVPDAPAEDGKRRGTITCRMINPYAKDKPQEVAP